MAKFFAKICLLKLAKDQPRTSRDGNTESPDVSLELETSDDGGYRGKELRHLAMCVGGLVVVVREGPEDADDQGDRGQQDGPL